MNNRNISTSLFSGLLKFYHQLYSALFLPGDKKEFQRLKDFIAS
ncbi:MAG: hypothetical protein ABIN94_05785 [Ferruginibacter sp.]